MRKSILLATVMFLPLMLLAQKSDDKPKAEIFGGYSYLSSNVGFPGGWDAQATGYITENLGITADFSGHYSSEVAIPNGLEHNVHRRLYTYLFGPTYTVRQGKHVAFFAHALAGGAHGSEDFTLTTTVTMFPPTTIEQPVKESDSAFAMALGGGLDLGVTKHFAVRVGQLDWLYTRFKGSSFAFGDAIHNYQNSFRYSGGVVVRF